MEEVFSKNTIALDSEEEKLVAVASKTLMKYRFPRVYDPFFYVLHYANKGMEKAVRDYNPSRRTNFEDFSKYVIEKSIACGHNYQYATKHGKQMIV